jgi:succinyl-diaminopimelate desuccinylase
MAIADPVELLTDLVRRASVTPEDAGCQQQIVAELEPFGFRIRHLGFGEVDNLFAWHGEQGPLLVFLGHTDVVPTGPESEWRFPPFAATAHDGLLYGRGSADMKASVAAMVVALQRFVSENPNHPGQLGLLLTSDEEGIAVDGVRRVISTLTDEGIQIDYCLVGEPSSDQQLGDQIRIGRRGSINGYLTVNGVQGHVAFPHLARNPIHQLAPALAELCAMSWDEGAADFPPTSFQVTQMTAGTGAANVIPGELKAGFNLRFNPASTADSLKLQVTGVLDRHDLDYDIQWQYSGDPFITREPELRAAVKSAVEQHCGITPVANTGGGTSDGRFVAPTGTQVVEFGPVNRTIHKLDEHVRLADVETLAGIYQTVAEEMLCE